MNPPPAAGDSAAVSRPIGLKFGWDVRCGVVKLLTEQIVNIYSETEVKAVAVSFAGRSIPAAPPPTIAAPSAVRLAWILGELFVVVLVRF